MNKKERLKRIKNMVQKAFNQNNYFEAMRLYIASSLYVKEKECDNCFHIKDPIYKNFLWDCKHGKHKDIIAADILSEMDDFIDDTSDYIDYDADKIITIEGNAGATTDENGNISGTGGISNTKNYKVEITARTKGKVSTIKIDNISSTTNPNP